MTGHGNDAKSGHLGQTELASSAVIAIKQAAWFLIKWLQDRDELLQLRPELENADFTDIVFLKTVPNHLDRFGRGVQKIAKGDQWLANVADDLLLRSSRPLPPLFKKTDCCGKQGRVFGRPRRAVDAIDAAGADGVRFGPSFVSRTISVPASTEERDSGAAARDSD